MSMLKYIMLLFVFTVCNSLFAQLSSLEVKRIKLKALDHVLRYESACAVSNDDQKDDFVKLFENDELEILNDVLPDNHLESKIAVKNYVDLIPLYFTYSLKISFIPYEIKLFEKENDQIEIVVLGLKAISGRENKSQVIYNDTLDISIKLHYNRKNEILKISDILLNEVPSKYLIIDSYQKFLFKRRPLRNDSILINDVAYITNEDGIIFLRKIKDQELMLIRPVAENLNGIKKIDQSDIANALVSISSKNMVNVTFRKSLLDIMPTIGLFPFTRSPIGYDNMNNKNTSSSEFGLTFGVILSEKVNGYWRVGFGVNTFKYEYENFINKATYQYASIDVDGAAYVRNNNIASCVEKHDLRGIRVPLTIERGFYIHKRLGISINVELAYNRISTAKTTSKAEAQFEGTYPDLFNITISENGVYDYGKFKLSQSQDLEKTPYFINYQVGIGPFYKINKKAKLNLSFMYRKSMSEIFKSENKMLSTNAGELNPINLTGKELKMQIILLSIGIQYKL
jgi:hypothetical protein